METCLTEVKANKKKKKVTLLVKFSNGISQISSKRFFGKMNIPDLDPIDTRG